MRHTDETGPGLDAGGADAGSDAELIRRIAAGDRAAVEPLFHRYHRRLYRFLVRMVKDEAMAEDLANEVFLDVWRGAGRFEGRSAASSWIFGIARNKALSALRKRRDVALTDETALALADPAANPGEAAEASDVAEILRRCLDALSAEHREVVELAYYQELSIQEIAEIVDIPENTVKTRMFHARKRLREIAGTAGLEGAV